MKRMALMVLALLMGGCARPFEVGWSPAYSARERHQQIARNWDMEGKQLVEDIDRALLLRPMGHLTIWHLR